MTQNNLSIFMKYTDATAVSMGFYYQYEATLNVWLENYLANSSVKIYCETEDDIKELDNQKKEIKFSQVKCYSNDFSLKSEAVTKSLCNFYMLYKEYHDTHITFEFIANTSIVKSDSLLREWVENQNSLTEIQAGNIKKEIRGILNKYFKNEKNRIIKSIDDKVNTILKNGGNKKSGSNHLYSSERENINNKYEEAIKEIADNKMLETFVRKIKWSFKHGEPNSVVRDLIEDNKKLIRQITKSDNAINLFYGRLFSEIHFRTSQKDIESRMLDNDLLELILLESQKEMEMKINHELISSVNQISEEISNIHLEIQEMRSNQEDFGFELIKESFKIYCEDKIEFFSTALYDENFSIFDIFVKTDFYSFPFQGDIFVHENFILEDQENNNKYSEDILIQLKMLLKQKFILIHGDPGIGKSSLSKVLFKYMYEQEEDIYPFHLDLKTIKYEQDFKTTIYNEMNENIQNFNNHLKKFNILLILDGFDELHLLAEGNLNVFFDDIIQFSKNYKNIKIVLTGRTNAFSEMVDLIPRETEIIFLKKFTETQVNEWLQKWGGFKSIPRQRMIELVEYNHYEKSIVRFPLLLYLFCKMIEEDASLSPKEMFELEKWEFYKKIIDWTCATSKFVEQEDFNPLRLNYTLEELSIIKRELNQNIALAMYHKNYFSIKKSDILSKELIPRVYLEGKLKGSLIEKDYNLINTFIVLNYMRPSQKDIDEIEIAFEFIHKSFYEFLVSEALINSLLSLTDENLEVHDLARTFYETFGGFKVTLEVISFLAPLIRDIPIIQMDSIRLNLQNIYAHFVLKSRFLNEHDNNILNNYFVKYPENSSKKIEIEGNAFFNLLFLLSFMGDLYNERYEIGNNKKDKDFRSLLLLLNNNLKINTLSLNNFRIINTEFIGDDLNEVDFNNSEFLNCSFNKVDLKFGDLETCNICEVFFKDCNLDNSTFRHSEINQTSYINSRMDNIVFSNSILSNVRFSNSLIQLSDFSLCRIKKSSFKKVVLTESDFYKTIIEKCDFINCDLQSINFENAIVKDSNFLNANLSNSNLDSADFSGSNLSGADLSFASLIGTNFTGADLTNVNLKGADISNANFHGAILKGIDFSEMYLYEDGLVNCNLTEADLTNSNLSVLNLTNLLIGSTDLSGANFAYSNLENVDLSNSNLLGSNFRNSNLKNANLSFSNISNAIFIEANLSFSKFNSCEITGTSFLGADLFSSQIMESNVRNSDFQSTSMILINLSGTDIRDSNFERAKINIDSLQNTVLINNKGSGL